MAGMFFQIRTVFFLSTICCLVAASARESLHRHSIFISDVEPQEDDAYFCRAFKVPAGEVDDHSWVVDVTSHVENAPLHHLDIFSCADPGYLTHSADDETGDGGVTWDCGLDGDSGIPGLIRAPRCKDSSEFVIPFEFPKKTSDKFGMGFKVGPKSHFKYLVMEAHFNDLSNVSDSTRAGFLFEILTSNNSSRLKDSAMMSMGTKVGSVPKHRITLLDSAFRYNHTEALNVVLYRSHAHGMAKIASAFRINDERQGTESSDDWQLLGRQSPQHTYPYFPLLRNDGQEDEDFVVRVEPGDMMAARCFYNNTGDRDLVIGETSSDEMCYFYLVYFVDHKHSIPYPFESCFNVDPEYTWRGDARLAHVVEDIDRVSQKFAANMIPSDTRV